MAVRNYRHFFCSGLMGEPINRVLKNNMKKVRHSVPIISGWESACIQTLKQVQGSSVFFSTLYRLKGFTNLNGTVPSIVLPGHVEEPDVELAEYLFVAVNLA
jgi:hypothetical protein